MRQNSKTDARQANHSFPP